MWVVLSILLTLLLLNGFTASAQDASAKPEVSDLTSQFQSAITQTPPFLTNLALTTALAGENQSNVKGISFLRVVTRAALAIRPQSDLPDSSMLKGVAEAAHLTPELALQESKQDLAFLSRGSGNEKVLAAGLQAALQATIDQKNRKKDATAKQSVPKSDSIASNAQSSPPASAPNVTSPTAGVPAVPAPLTSDLRDQLNEVRPVGFVQTYALALIKENLLNQHGAVAQVSGTPPPMSGLILTLGLYATAFCCGPVLLIVFFYVRGHNALPEFIHPVEAKTKEESSRLALQAVGLIALFIVLQVGAAIILQPFQKSNNKSSAGTELLVMAAVELVMVAGTIALTFWTPWRKRISLAKMGLTWPKPRQTILWGVGGYCVANFTQITLTLLLAPFIHQGGSAHPLTKELGAMSHSPLAILATFVTACIGAPFFEEFVFRGALTPAFRKVFGPGPNSLFWAMILTSMLFGMSHPTGPPSWIPLASIGVINCVLCYQTRSLWPAIICHACFNGAQLLLTLSLARHGMLFAAF